jgi:hypothetical protein
MIIIITIIIITIIMITIVIIISSCLVARRSWTVSPWNPPRAGGQPASKRRATNPGTA